MGRTILGHHTICQTHTLPQRPPQPACDLCTVTSTCPAGEQMLQHQRPASYRIHDISRQLSPSNVSVRICTVVVIESERTVTT